MARSRKKLGDILVGWGMISQGQADQASAAALSSGRRLGDVLVEMGFAKEDQVAKALANQFGMEFIDLSAQGVASKVDMKIIATDLIKKHTILPLE